MISAFRLKTVRGQSSRNDLQAALNWAPRELSTTTLCGGRAEVGQSDLTAVGKVVMEQYRALEEPLDLIVRQMKVWWSHVNRADD